MTTWHLNSLKCALESRGWKILQELPGNDYQVSARWDVKRNRARRRINFMGLDPATDGMTTLPLEKSYACEIAGVENSGLYFRRSGVRGSHRRALWKDDLDAFLDKLEPGEHGNARERAEKH